MKSSVGEIKGEGVNETSGETMGETMAETAEGTEGTGAESAKMVDWAKVV